MSIRAARIELEKNYNTPIIAVTAVTPVRVPNIENLVIGKTVDEVTILYPDYKIHYANKLMTFNFDYFRLAVWLDENGKIIKCKNN